MELFTNDRSLHLQFHDLATFRIAVGRLGAMRDVALRFGRNVYCHRMLLNVEPIRGMQMQQAVGRLGVNQRRALMTWLKAFGPFWDDLRSHCADDYLECNGEIVTDTGVGEAAHRSLQGVECALISAIPSEWNYSPVEVTWHQEVEGRDSFRNAVLDNWRDHTDLLDRLRGLPPLIRSWVELGDSSRTRYQNLKFADRCFEPLNGVPFSRSAADRIIVLLSYLNQLASEFDAGGSRTSEGHRIYQSYFTGDNALFSDSSDTEKHRFLRELTFPHPDRPHETLFCAWHGKVPQLTLRLHFSWPIRADEPVYVVYAGPKITKR